MIFVLCSPCRHPLANGTRHHLHLLLLEPVTTSLFPFRRIPTSTQTYCPAIALSASSAFDHTTLVGVNGTASDLPSWSRCLVRPLFRNARCKTPLQRQKVRPVNKRLTQWVQLGQPPSLPRRRLQEMQRPAGPPSPGKAQRRLAPLATRARRMQKYQTWKTQPY